MANTRIPGTIIRSGSIPTTALGGGVVSSSAQVINHINNQKITPAQITASGHIVPSATEIYDLGSSNLKFRDLYLSGSTIYLGTLVLSDSGGTLAVRPSGSPAGTSSPVSGAFTGSFFGDIFATNGVISSSAQVIASLPTNTVSSSAQATAFLPTGTVSSSGQVDIINTTNYTSFSSSIATIDTTQTSRLAAIENVTGSYATTGSNTFVSAQTISDTTNSTSYLDGALHVAGGMSVRKDMRVSGSLTVNGLLTAVSMSTQYVTASEYNVGVSKITLNDDDTVRFAGISIYDSGSSSPTSASIYWDSLQHRFIYENLSGSSYNSSIIIAGPKHTGSLGDEPTLTSGYIPYATGGDHIDNSVMFQSSSNIGIGTTNPSYRLHVNNIIASDFGFLLSNGQYTSIAGVPYAGMYLTEAASSDGFGALLVSSRSDVARPILFGTSNGSVSTERMRIALDGNIGIGTTNPTVNLQVSGTIATGDSTNGWGRLSYDAGVVRLIGSKNGTDAVDMALSTQASGGTLNEKMRITGAGSVGIGTTSPGQKLHVQDGRVLINSAHEGYGQLWIRSSGAGNEASITFAVNGYASASAGNNPGGNPRWVVGSDGNFWIYNDQAGSRFFTVTTSGNVGIGTTEVSSKFSIVGGSLTTTGNSALSFSAGLTTGRAGTYDAGNAAVIHTYYDSSTVEMSAGSTANYVSAISVTGNNASTFTGTVRLVTTSTERLRITPGGNVGIGLTNPQSLLHISGSGTQIRITGEGGGNSLVLQGGTGSNMKITGYNYGSSTAVPLYISVDGANTIMQSSGGNVGIGTTNPVARLHVAADQAVYNNDTAQLVLSGATATTKRLLLGFNTTADKAFIQATDTSANYRDLLLNPNAGNVGVGTTNPTDKLQVNGTFRVTSTTGDVAYIGSTFATAPTNGRILHLRDDKATTSVDSFISIGWTSSPGQDVYAGKRTTSNAGYYAIQNSSGNEIFTIDLANQRVGIGITNPDYKLHIPVNNNLYLSNLYITGTSQNPVLSSGATGGSMSFEGGGLGQGKIYIQGAASGGNGYIEFSIGGTSRATINSSGHFVPGADNTYNLGSTSLRWANLYTADLHFSNKGKQNDVDGTWGDWTLQEGDENIFLLNHRNGKKYKIKLEEI